MFNLKYNILASLQIAFTLLNAFLLIKNFGVSSETDAYFMLQTIFAAISLLQYMPVEQFMFFYNDAKKEGKKSAADFYCFSLFVSFATGMLFFLCFYFFQDYVIAFFAYKLDALRLRMLGEFVSIYKWSLFFIPLTYICSSLLNAEMKIGYSYLVSMLPTVFTVIVQLLLYNCSSPPMIYLVKAGLAGVVTGGLLLLFIVKIKLGYGVYPIFRHKLSLKYVKNSVAMRFGHNIHSFLFPLATNNFLSAFPSGFVSYFYYAQRIVGILQALIIGPSSRMLQSRIASMWSDNLLGEIKEEVKKYYKFFSLLFLFSAFICYFAIPFAFEIIASSVPDSGVRHIQIMFAFLALWSFVLFIESPFDMILISSKNSRIFMAVNSIFILTYSLILFFLKNKLGINAIFMALIIGQSINFFFYFRGALKVLNLGQKRAIEKVINYVKTRIQHYYPNI